MSFFTVADPAAPSVEERAADGTWVAKARLAFARQAVEALMELHESQPRPIFLSASSSTRPCLGAGPFRLRKRAAHLFPGQGILPSPNKEIAPRFLYLVSGIGG